MSWQRKAWPFLSTTVSGPSTESATPQSDSKVHLALDDWDNWFGRVDSDTSPSESDSQDKFDDI